MSFAEIIGQKKQLNFLKNIIKQNRIPTSFLFCGIEGIGKLKSALEFAKALNCKEISSEIDSCDKCPSCVSLDKKIHPDITVADFNFQAALLNQPPEKQQHIKIETIRNLTAKAQQKPSLADWKVFIVDKAETMLAPAANALLKLLEEPPPNTLWILVTTKLSAMLPTIISRCQSVNFSALTSKEVADILNKENFSSDEVKQLSELSQGSVKKAGVVKDILAHFSDLDALGINYPFEVSSMMAKDLVSARRQAAVILEIIITTLYQKLKTESDNAVKMQIYASLKKCFKFETFLLRNVSPHKIIEYTLLETEPFKLNIFK